MLTFKREPSGTKPKHRHKHKHKHKHHGHHHRHASAEVERQQDREREMTMNRLVLIMITLSISVFLDADLDLLLGFKLHLIASLSIMIAFRLNPRPSSPRLLAGLATDFGAGIYLFDIGGGAVAALYPLFLWIILGYGFRFGLKWLYIATALGSLSFAWTVFTVDFWLQNRSLAIGLLLGMVVIPAYCSTLIKKLSKATAEAEAANKSKSLFLASISHELRTPLNAIIGYGTHLLDMKLPDTQRQMVATSVSAGQHLLHLINQLLNFAQSDTKEELPEPREFSIVDVLAEVRDIMRIAAEEKGLEIHLQAEAMSDQPIAGQLDYVRNILINLSSNAVKFTESGSVILKCGLNETRDGTEMWCSVTDTGPGIPETAHEKIFGVFQQADDSVISNFGGTGLGLAICRQLVLQMGGNIVLESAVGEGSTFTLSCPVEPAAELALQSPSEANAEPLRILSLGRGENALQIADADAENCTIEHVQCNDDKPLDQLLGDLPLSTYDVALLEPSLADAYSDRPGFWQLFEAAQLPPVLISENDSKDLDEIRLRAAFASVLPSSPDFNAVRSVVQIGCSFHRGGKQESDDPDKIVRADVSLNILVADDNRTNQMVLKTILNNAGHTVEAVLDGEKALAALEEQHFDLVFLDVNMPLLDGIECCKMWRQIEGPRSHVPIIGLTADSTIETERKCLDAGMDLRLTKPIEAGLLLDTVAEQTGNVVTAADAALPGRDEDPFQVVQSLTARQTDAFEQPIDLTQIVYLQSIGDETFVQSVVDAYVEDMVEILVAFEESIEQHNVDKFRFHAHAFKSGATNVGAARLAKMCSILEVITEEDFESRKLEYLSDIQSEVARITDCLKTLDLSDDGKANGNTAAAI